MHEGFKLFQSLILIPLPAPASLGGLWTPLMLFVIICSPSKTQTWRYAYTSPGQPPQSQDLVKDASPKQFVGMGESDLQKKKFFSYKKHPPAVTCRGAELEGKSEIVVPLSPPLTYTKRSAQQPQKGCACFGPPCWH